MAVLNRFTSLLSADMHAVLDKLEDPIASLKLAIREMESALSETRQKLESCRQQREFLQRQQRLCETQIEELDKQLDVCFESAEDDLARSVLRKKLVSEKRHADLAKALTEQEALLERDNGVYCENERRLQAMQEKLTLLAQQEAVMADREQPMANCEYTISDEAVEVALLREKRRRAQ